MLLPIEVTVRGDWSNLITGLKGWNHFSATHPGGDDSYIDKNGWRLRTGLIEGFSCIAPESQFLGFKSEVFEESLLIFDHVALEVPLLTDAVQRWQSLLGFKPLIATSQTWDPLINAPLSAAHFYVPGQIYLTLRENQSIDIECFHHLGWEARNGDAMHQTRENLQSMDTEIFWEGEIDGSEVIHFIGPDKKIHDVFLPSNTLRSRASR